MKFHEQYYRVGVDLAKRVIQVLAVNAVGQRVTGRALARDRFLSWCAHLVAPYRMQGKSGKNDAAAICEAA